MDDISINCPHENFNVNHDLTQNPPRFIILTILILSLSDTEHVSLFFIHMFYHIGKFAHCGPLDWPCNQLFLQDKGLVLSFWAEESPLYSLVDA